MEIKINIGKKHLWMMFVLAAVLGIILVVSAADTTGKATHGTLYVDAIGKKTGTGAITVNTQLTATSTGTGSKGVYGSATGDNSAGVYGVGEDYGVYGYIAPVPEKSGMGVFGKSEAEFGIGVLGHGVDRGVQGQDTDSGAYAILGYGDYGVYGSSVVSVDGIGVRGYGKRYGVEADGTTCDFNAKIGAGTDYCSGGVDVAEYFLASDDLEKGDVVVIDTSRKEAVKKSTKAYDTLAAGVVSTEPSITLGYREDNTGKQPIALAGRVPVKVSAENGAIKIGDLLTTSNTAGYAMKCKDRIKCTDAIIGKALEPLNSGKGKITVLISLG